MFNMFVTFMHVTLTKVLETKSALTDFLLSKKNKELLMLLTGTCVCVSDKRSLIHYIILRH
jgi:hypothetical protein